MQLDKFNKRYDVLYIDPPWQFKTYSDKGKEKSPEKHYGCMTLDDIKNLNVGKLGKDDSVLLLWTISTLLPEALEIIKLWGYTYKTVGFVWVKQNKKNQDTNFFGLGYHTRQNAELCLLATKGKPKRASAAISQIQESEVEVWKHPIGPHSQKPHLFREHIEELYGLEKDYLEIFGRNNFDKTSLKADWQFTGLEYDGFNIMEL